MSAQRPTTKPSTPASPYTPTASQPKAKETRGQREKKSGSESPLSTVMDRVETVYLDDPGRIRHLKLKQALDAVYGSKKNREGRWTYVKREEVAATRARQYLRLPRLSPKLLDPETIEPQAWRIIIPPLKHHDRFYIRADGKIVDVSDPGAPGQAIAMGDNEWQRQRRQYIRSRMIRYRARLLEDLLSVSPYWKLRPDGSLWEPACSRHRSWMLRRSSASGYTRQ